MPTLDAFLDQHLARGRITFTRGRYPKPARGQNPRMNAPLRVPPALLRELEKIAAQSRRDLAELTADALRQFVRSRRETVHLARSRANVRRLRAAHSEIEARRARARRAGRTIARMKELELKLSLPDRIASQAKAAGLLTSEAIERLVRQAIRKAAAERLVEYGKRLREPGGPEITEAELESELKAVRAELREAGARRP